MAKNMHLVPVNLLADTGTPPRALSSLKGLADAAVAKSAEAQGWYRAAIPRKRTMAVLTRLGAMALGSAGTIVPTALGIAAAAHGNVAGDPTLLQRWVPLGGVLTVVAAMLVLIDKFAGFSSGWMRYISADQDLRTRQEQFQVAWAKELLLIPSDQTESLPPERALALLQLVAEFVASSDEIVRAETQAWIAEFKTALAELDKAAADARGSSQQAAIPSSPRGSIEVAVAGLAKLDQQTWNLHLGHAPTPVTYVGAANAAVTDLVPGPIKLRVDGLIGGKPWSVEKAVEIEAGKTTQVAVAAEPAAGP